MWEGKEKGKKEDRIELKLERRDENV